MAKMKRFERAADLLALAQFTAEVNALAKARGGPYAGGWSDKSVEFYYREGYSAEKAYAVLNSDEGV